MSIEYTYEVINVDHSARCMEIVYKSAGRQTQHIGARLPHEGESVEAVVQMYAPVAYWQEQEAKVQSVAIGTSGTLGGVAPKTLSSVKAAKLAEVAADRYAVETSSTRVYNVLVATDRASQAALNNARLSLETGAVQSVNLKCLDGEWLELTAEQMTAVVKAVALHVQTCFNTEKQLIDLISAATNIEAVEAIKWPK